MHKLGTDYTVTLKFYTSGSEMRLNVVATATNHLIDQTGNIVKQQFGVVRFDSLKQDWIKPVI